MKQKHVSAQNVTKIMNWAGHAFYSQTNHLLNNLSNKHRLIKYYSAMLVFITEDQSKNNCQN